MLLNQPSRLPFPHDQLIPGNNVADPNSYAFPIPQSGPEAVPHLRFIAANLAILLQNYANSGYISAFAYNLFSHNRWSNDAWLAIVADTYDFATKLAMLNPNSDIGQILSTAVTRYHAYAVANCVNRYPDLQVVVPMQMVSNAINTVNQYRAALQQIDVQIQRQQAQTGANLVGMGGFQQQSQLPSGGTASIVGGIGDMMTNIVSEFNPDEGDGWRGRRKLSAKLAEELGVKSADELKPKQPQQSFGGLPPMNQGSVTPIPPGMDVPATQAIVPPRRKRPAPATVQPTEPADHQEDDFMQLLNQEPERVPVKEHVEERPQIQVREEPREEPQIEERPQIQARILVIPESNMDSLPDTEEDLLMSEESNYRTAELVEAGEEFGVWMSEDGDLVKVVSPTAIGWTMHTEQLTRTPFNPTKWHRAFVQHCTVDGNLVGPISEGFIAIKEGDPVDYLDLELDPGIRAKALVARDYNKKYIPTPGEVFEISVVNNNFGFSRDKQGEPIKAEERQLSVYALNRGQRKAPALACIELSAVMAKRDKDFLGGAVANEEQIRIRANDLETFITRHLSCDSATPLELEGLFGELVETMPTLGRQLDKLITDEVNLRLLHGFGLETTVIESFYEDYEDLLELLRDTHSAEGAEVFHESIKAFLSSLYWNGNGNVFTFSQEGLSVYLHGTITNYGVKLVSKRLGLAKLSSATQLGLVLNEALTRLNFRVDSHNSFVSFSDGEVWRVIPSVWDENHLTFVQV